MADILIKGLALPTDGSELVIKITRHRQIAKVYGNPSTRGSSWLIVHGARAIELPEHGVLKDVDKLLRRIDWGCCKDCHGKDVDGGCAGCSTKVLIDEIKATCTIVEVSNADN